MLKVYLLKALPLLIGSTLATPLQGQGAQQLTSTLPANLTNLRFPGNKSTSTVLTSGENTFDIKCDGATYGFNPNIADCDEARSYIVPDSDQLYWGERHTGLPQEIFPLPFVIFGGKLPPSCSHRSHVDATTEKSINSKRKSHIDNALLTRQSRMLLSDHHSRRRFNRPCKSQPSPQRSELTFSQLCIGQPITRRDHEQHR